MALLKWLGYDSRSFSPVRQQISPVVTKGRNEYHQVLRLLLYEKVFGRPEKDGLLHHGEDERTRQRQPTDKNPVEKEVGEDLGKHKFVVPTATE